MMEGRGELRETEVEIEFRARTLEKSNAYVSVGKINVQELVKFCVCCGFHLSQLYLLVI